MCPATWVTISLEKSLPGLSSWGKTAKPALREGTRFALSIHEAMPCREGGCSVFTTSTCTSCAPQYIPRARRKLLALPQKRSWGTGRNSLLAVQIITWPIQRNAYKKIPSCVFVQATCLFFRLQKIQKDRYFFKQQYFSYCYFYFHQWTIGNGGVSY